MSNPIRVAVAVEGPTDAIVLQAILKCILGSIEFEFQILQPEGAASIALPSTGVGWAGVYRWCRQSATKGGGSVGGSAVFSNHDLLVVHVDADVAKMNYSRADIQDAPCQDLPCNQPCPPPEATTDALRMVVVRWLGERQCPSQVVLCTPSMNMDAWVIGAVFPSNAMVTRGDWECNQNPQGQLGNIPKKQRFQKSQRGYRAKQTEISSGWGHLSQILTEAGRFDREFRAALQSASTCAPRRSLGR